MKNEIMTTIKLEKKVVEFLKHLGDKGDTYNDIIKRLLKKVKLKNGKSFKK